MSRVGSTLSTVDVGSGIYNSAALPMSATTKAKSPSFIRRSDIVKERATRCVSRQGVRGVMNCFPLPNVDSKLTLCFALPTAYPRPQRSTLHITHHASLRRTTGRAALAALAKISCESCQTGSFPASYANIPMAVGESQQQVRALLFYPLLRSLSLPYSLCVLSSLPPPSSLSLSISPPPPLLSFPPFCSLPHVFYNYTIGVYQNAARKAAGSFVVGKNWVQHASNGGALNGDSMMKTPLTTVSFAKPPALQGSGGDLSIQSGSGDLSSPAGGGGRRAGNS